MKRTIPVTAILCALLISCNPTSSTTVPAGNDSTAVTATDSGAKMVDSAANAVAVAPEVDSAVVIPTAPDNGKKISSSNTPDPVVAKNRLTVSFISMGGGIDHKAKTTFEKFIADFGKRNKTKLTYETVGWGREGEVDYCFPLTELKELQKAAFVQESKALLNGNELVQFKENTACRLPRK